MKPDKTRLLLVLVVILATLSWITSCTHNSDITDSPEVCFERDVLPIFTTSCAMSGCHDGRGEAGRALDNYTDILEMVVPGNADASRSYQAITDKWGFIRMPPDQPLSIDNRTTIRLWIEQGANQTQCVINSLPAKSNPAH